METGIAASLKSLSDYEYQNKVLRIELEYKLRLFNILLKNMEI
jgi:hypothetical protein